MNYQFNMPTKLHFGMNKTNDLHEIASMYGKTCFLVTTKNEPPLDGLYNRIKDQLIQKGFEVVHFDEVVPNPTTHVVESGIESLKNSKAEFILAVGGGSSIDTAKTIALLNGVTRPNWDEIFNTFNDPHGVYEPVAERYMPLISIPTTAGTGSEVTQAAVISKGDDKNTIFHPHNYSDAAILDPKLLLTLPSRLTASTGFDAFTHAFESYVHPKASPLTELNALEAMSIIADTLPRCIEDPKNETLREKLLFAQILAGISLSNAGAVAPHPLSEILGGITHISHGEALALIFPEFIKHNKSLNPDKFAKVARILNPELNQSTDREATERLESLMVEFLKSIDLYRTFESYDVTLEQFSNVMNCPILKYLPFGSVEELQSIYIEAYNNR